MKRLRVPLSRFECVSISLRTATAEMQSSENISNWSDSWTTKKKVRRGCSNPQEYVDLLDVGLSPVTCIVMYTIFVLLLVKPTV